MQLSGRGAGAEQTRPAGCRTGTRRRWPKARVYAGYCASCHGADLTGGENWRQRDAEGYLPAPPHDASGHIWHHPDSQLIAITAYGSARIAGGGYKSRMAGYSGVLSDEDILNVLAYNKSTWPKDVIARLNEINARAKS